MILQQRALQVAIDRMKCHWFLMSFIDKYHVGLGLEDIVTYAGTSGGILFVILFSVTLIATTILCFRIRKDRAGKQCHCIVHVRVTSIIANAWGKYCSWAWLYVVLVIRKQSKVHFEEAACMCKSEWSNC